MSKMTWIVFFIASLYFMTLVDAIALKRVLDFKGKGTYYDVGAGSCGKTDYDSEMVVAINKEQMDNGANPNSNPKCHQKVKIVGNLKHEVVARVVDTCPGCDSGSLDMSPAVFKKVCGSLSVGTCPISWGFD